MMANAPRWFVNGQGQTYVIVPGPVEGSLKPNDPGLFDLLGNECEWCADVGVGYRRLREG